MSNSFHMGQDPPPPYPGIALRLECPYEQPPIQQQPLPQCCPQECINTSPEVVIVQQPTCSSNIIYNDPVSTDTCLLCCLNCTPSHHHHHHHNGHSDCCCCCCCFECGDCHCGCCDCGSCDCLCGDCDCEHLDCCF